MVWSRTVSKNIWAGTSGSGQSTADPASRSTRTASSRNSNPQGGALTLENDAYPHDQAGVDAAIANGEPPAIPPPPSPPASRGNRGGGSSSWATLLLLPGLLLARRSHRH